jgi:glycosyltransferase involved in cell wall biosynthesis
MYNPTVSFVIPCYKLAHLLSECVTSILTQTYADFEIIIMDDCSPDNTAEVARSFRDPRVKYVRNEQNLGHLRNYNRGISLSCGKYVWLISADDYLRRPHALQRYVHLMERHPRVGYTFCPGVGVTNDKETGVLGCYRNRDCIVKGHTFLKRLLASNFIVAASVMVRRECYENISLFPLEAACAGVQVDMGWLGDWYLWCVFALYFDVGYFWEPMVCYREHDLAMSSSITRRDNVENCAASEVGMLWMMRQKASELGLTHVSKECLRAVADQYARHGASKQYRSSTYCMSIEQFEASIRRSTDIETERKRIRARFLQGAGDKFYFAGDRVSAHTAYLAALHNDIRLTKVYAKLLLSLLGTPGHYVRRLLSHRGWGASSVGSESRATAAAAQTAEWSNGTSTYSSRQGNNL